MMVRVSTCPPVMAVVLLFVTATVSLADVDGERRRPGGRTTLNSDVQAEPLPATERSVRRRAVHDTRRTITGEFWCGFDWDQDGALGAGDIVACLDAAGEQAGSREDGTDSSVVVRLPEGVFDLSGVTTLPYILQGGMTIRGVPPRSTFTGAGSEDGSYFPNGGTWLDGGGGGLHTIFRVDNARDVHISDVGFRNFKVGLQFGDDSVRGASWSILSNLAFSAGCNSLDQDCTGIRWYNGLQNHITDVHCRSMETCLQVISQHGDYQPGNMVVTGLKVSALDNTDGAIKMEVRPPTGPGPWEEGACTSLNYITLIRPQVNVSGPAGMAGSTGILLSSPNTGDCQGNVPNGISIVAADIEGPGMECGIRLVSTFASTLEVVGGHISPENDMVCVDSQSIENVIISSSGAASVRIENGDNTFLGTFNRFRSSIDPPPVNGFVRVNLNDRSYLALNGRMLYSDSSQGEERFYVSGGLPEIHDTDSPDYFLRQQRLITSSGTGTPGALPMVSGNWYGPERGGLIGEPVDIQLGVAHRIYFYPFSVESRTAFSRIGVHVASAGPAGEEARLGVYEAGYLTGGSVPSGPGRLLHQSESLDVASTGDKVAVVPGDLVLEPGLYYLAILGSGSSASYRGAAAAGAGFGTSSLESLQQQTALVLDHPFGELPAQADGALPGVVSGSVRVGLRKE